MATGQPIEPRAVEMVGFEQGDAAIIDIDHRLLCLRDFQESESGAAAIIAVAHQHDRAFGAGQNHIVDLVDFAHDRRALRQQPVYVARRLHPQHRNFGFGDTTFGLRLLDIAALGAPTAKRDGACLLYTS